jgi:hypothetical protein
MFRILAALVAVLTCILTMRSTAQAHVVCGDRVFPTTLTMDDPGVGDEVSLPTIAFTPTSSGQSNSYGFEWDKSITEDLTFAIDDDYVTQRDPSQRQHLAGWDNVDLTLKDQHPCSSVHPHQEFVWSVGLVRELVGTGSKQLRNAGAIDDVGVTEPTFYFGKGFGTASPYLRPFAITGEIGRGFSDTPSASPNAWDYAFSLQYSTPYLNQNVRAAVNTAQLFTRLTPIVEFAFTSPDQGTPTGTISPGFLYDAPSWQLGAEAVFPATKGTSQMQGAGFIVQYHVFLDTFYKSWFGKPLIKKNLWGNQ